jgi:hypothetical protein
MLAVVLFGFCTCDQLAWSLASPGPQLLQDILASADMVAVATVVKNDHQNATSRIQAKLQIEKVVHGKLKQRTVLIENIDENACMGPVANYVVGQRVLVFLNQLPSGRFAACGSAFGVKVLNKQQRSKCIQRITEFHRIRWIKDEANRKRQWAQWAVQCAEEPSTRSGGLELLCRGSYGELGGKPSPTELTWYFPLLDRTQQERMLDLLRRLPSGKKSSDDVCRIMRVISFARQDKSLLAITKQTEALYSDGRADVKHLQKVSAKADALRKTFAETYEQLRKHHICVWPNTVASPAD